MSNKIFNYRYRATATASNYGTTDFVVNNVSGYGTISSLVNTTAGSQDRFYYSITFADSTIVYEYGIGYLTNLGGGIYQLTRETAISSSTGTNSKVNILSSYGNIYIDIVNNHPNYTDWKRLNSNSDLVGANSTYFIDAATNLSFNLPAIGDMPESISIGFIITSLSGVENERDDAVTLTATDGNTINGDATYVLTKKNDFVRIISDPTNENWIILDPAADVASSSGPDGAVQLADGGVLGYASGLNYTNSALWIGGTGELSADVKISEFGSIFNVQSGDIDFAIHSNGIGNTFFVDASTNNVGIGTNTPSDVLNINATGNEGLTVSTTTTNAIPTVKLLNNDSGFVEGMDIGRIDFVGTNDVDENITYSRLISEAFDRADGSEEGLVKLQVNNNSTLQTVAVLSYADIQIGPDNSISGGIIIGNNNTNQGDNICVGYYNSNCGTSSISIGSQNTIESGAYASVIGTDHTVTGSYLWVFGGSGANISGTDTTYLLVDPSNYIKLNSNDQQRIGVYINSTGTNFNIVNTRISSVGTEHSHGILFRNSAGSQVTGVAYGIEVLDPTNTSEDTRFFIRVLDDGVATDVLNMSASNVNISNLSGIDDTVFIGSHLAVTGTGSNVTIVGLHNTIVANSGENTIVGYNNELTTSGNDHIVVIGNSNTIDDNYSVTVGLSNQNSGLYSSVVGYNNGVYGENISIVGVNNSISGNNSSIIGYQNTVTNHNVYVIGQGNTSAYSGVHMIGKNITAAAHNTTYIYNDNIVITGTTVNFDADVSLNGSTLLDGYVIVSSGDNVSLLVNDANYVASGDNISELNNDAGYLTSDAYVTGIFYDGSGELVLSTHSGTVTGVLTDVAHSGDNISVFVNDANYISSNNYNPTLTFHLTGVSEGAIRWNGAGTNADELPHIYLYKGFTYAFNCSGLPSSGFAIYDGSSQLAIDGITNNTGVMDGVVLWTVQHDTATTNLHYRYDTSLSYSGSITIV